MKFFNITGSFPDPTANWPTPLRSWWYRNSKGRNATWYWRIWWWMGYHGLYQINWDWKNWLVEIRSYRAL
jgi:hypothetical protein